MKEFFEISQYLWGLYGWLGIAVLAILTELRWGPLRKIYRGLDALSKSEKTHKDLHEEVSEVRLLIEKELKHNGGTSLKDALRRTEQLVQRLAAQAHVGMELHPYGIFMCDFDGNNFYVNRTYANKLGATKEELMHLGWEDFVEDYSRNWVDVFKKGKDLSADVVFRTKSGEIVSCRVIATVLDGMGGYMGYLIFEQ
jgi:PAS domain S-box-containing protein